MRRLVIVVVISGSVLGAAPEFSATTLLPRAAAQGGLLVNLGKFLVGWIAGHALDRVTGLDGTADTRQLKRELNELARNDRANAARILQLRSDLRDGMLRTDVERLLRKTLAEVDVRLLKLASEVAEQRKELNKQLLDLTLNRQQLDKLYAQFNSLDRRLKNELREHQQRLDVHEERISRIEQRMDDHSSRVDDHDERLRRLSAEIEAFRRDYPRISPEEQGAQLGVAGMTALRNGDTREAIVPERNFGRPQRGVNDARREPVYGVGVQGARGPSERTRGRTQNVASACRGR